MQEPGYYTNELIVINSGDIFAVEDANQPDPSVSQNLITANVFAKSIQIVEDIGTPKSYTNLHPGSPLGQLSQNRVVRCTPIDADKILQVCGYFYKPGLQSTLYVGADSAGVTKVLLLPNNTYELTFLVQQGGTTGFPNGFMYKLGVTYRTGSTTPTDQQLWNAFASLINQDKFLSQFVTATVTTTSPYYLIVKSNNVGANFTVTLAGTQGFGVIGTTTSSCDTLYAYLQPASDEVGGYDYMSQLWPTVYGYGQITMAPGEPTQYIAPKKFAPGCKYGVIYIQHYKDQPNAGIFAPIQKVINLYIAIQVSSSPSANYDQANDYIWPDGGVANGGGIRKSSTSVAGTTLREWLNAVNPAWIPETSSKIFGV